MTRWAAVADWLTRETRKTSYLEESGMLGLLTWAVTSHEPLGIRFLVLTTGTVTLMFTAGFIRGAVSAARRDPGTAAVNAGFRTINEIRAERESRKREQGGGPHLP